MRKLISPSESKLSKTIAKITQNDLQEKTGFITSERNKSSCYKTKSFRLRESDSLNLKKIIKEVNKVSERKIYSDSEVIRGIINFMSENIESNIKKLIPHINNSS
jgi:hypothetical protein